MYKLNKRYVSIQEYDKDDKLASKAYWEDTGEELSNDDLNELNMLYGLDYDQDLREYYLDDGKDD